MKVDMHIHTRYSGHSLLTPDSVVKTARRRGLGCVAITDHNSIRGAKEVARLFPTILGEEISCSEGDVIGLFLTEEIAPGQTLDVMDRIRGQGGLVMIPHPFDSMRSEALMSEELCAKGDIIEVFNSRVIKAEDNERADTFAKARGIPRVVGSDAHTALEIGRSWLEVEDAETPKGLLSSLERAELHMERSPVIVHAQTKVLKSLRR